MARRTGVLLTAQLSILCLLVLVSPASAGPQDGRRGGAATISYTEFGIPHIVARDLHGLGLGYGYASATDNVCSLADVYVTVAAQRSLFHGADAPAAVGITTAENSLNSDLFFQRINDSKVVEQYVATAPAPIRELVQGFAAGFNRFLSQHPVRDPSCAGAVWVRPINELDVFRYVHAVALLDGSGAQIDGLVDAQPPDEVGRNAPSPGTADELAEGFRPGDGNGSNAVAAGADATTSGTSVLLANPHFPWQGALRFWQTHLTIPGRFDVSGASLPGLPVVAIGHNADVAWSHTVSTASTLGLFEVPTVPGSPTTYLVDSKPQQMTGREVSVQVRNPDGSIGTVTRTLWSTRYGPVLDSLSGVPLPWGRSAFVLRDANTTNLRLLETWLGMGQATSVQDLRSTLADTLGIPWTNTLATDRHGDALYTDTQVVAHVTDELAARCNTQAGAKLFARTGLSILDGSRSSCDWGYDPGTPVPGVLGADRLPTLIRRDYTANANNAPWLANPEAPLTGYPRVIGPAVSAPSLRAQQVLLTTQRRIAGTDGLPDKGFSSQTMRDLLFADSSRFAEISLSDLHRMCASFVQGQAPSAQGPVDATAGCAAITHWDGNYRTDSRGSLLFSRFVTKLGEVPGGPWRVPFDRDKPLTTPNSLAVDRPEVQSAFGDAARELADAEVPADAALGEHQYVTRNGARIPIHGGPSKLGVMNVVTPVWGPGGNTEIVHGSSTVQIVEFDRDTGPTTYSLLTYAQSADPTSPHYSDQTELFSRSEWVQERFTESEIRASPALKVVEVPG